MKYLASLVQGGGWISYGYECNLSCTEVTEPLCPCCIISIVLLGNLDKFLFVLSYISRWGAGSYDKGHEREWPTFVELYPLRLFLIPHDQR